ncbi:MAG TPA: oligosaccharide flippase family protein [Noviherbaspirillum sp.]|jgi:O-antigen/teichoic acid export membrane protein|uniref:oligosaccharide flippase family protein n=1 Tax=Noviherbaspirillum sp. TaxID=1926288 RepID=UPI002F92A9C7
MTPPILSSVLWSLCRSWGGRLAGFVIYFQLVRVLTPEEMGLFSAAFAVFVFFEIFVDHGMVQAVVQRPAVDPPLLTAVLLVNVVAALLLAGCLWLLADRIEALVGMHGLAEVLQVGCLTLLISSAGFTQEAMARRTFQFRRLALRTVVSTVAGGFVGVYLAATGHGVWALVTQMLLSAAINTLIVWCRPAWNPFVRPDFTPAAALAGFGAQVTGMRLVEFGAGRGTELLIGALLGAPALGLFAVGTKLHYIFVQLLGLALSDVAQAGFARLAADPVRLREAYLSSVAAVALVSTPAWIVLSAAAPEAADIAFGPRWSAAAQVLAPFALLGALQVLQKFDTAALTALGRPSLSLLLSAARAAAALFSAWAFHGKGLQVVAHAVVVSQLLVTPLNLWLLRKALGLRASSWMQQLWRPVLAAAAAWWAMQAYRQVDHIALGSLDLPMMSLLRFLVLSMVGGVAYLLVLALIARDQLHRLRFGMRALRES